jgi:predicted nucleic acid-binding protein
VATYRICLDSGAFSALAKEDEAVRTAVRQALKNGGDVIVPTVVVAESTTGNGTRDANVNRVLGDLQLVDLDERFARAAAALRHALRRSGAGTIDAAVIATADAVPGTRVLTGDPNDLRPLAAVAGLTSVVALEDV